jgi:hypothetical protein
MSKTKISHEQQIQALEKKLQEITEAVVADMSKILFRIDAIDKQLAEIGIKEVAAAPRPEPEDPETLPGMNDLDEFKPEGFEGETPRVAAAKEPPKLDDGDPFADDGIKLTDEQMAELDALEDEDQEDLDQEDEEDV